MTCDASNAIVLIAREPPRQAEVLALLAQSDAYMAERYPAESNQLLDVDALEAPNVAFFVARAAACAIGCGALVRHDARVAELKRVYVTEAARGLKAGLAIVQALERHAARTGAAVIRLETGTRQPEALRLYERLGYRRRGPFGGYRDDPYSVFMEKTLRG